MESIDPGAAMIILIGGPFTADTGEQLDSRQPFVEDPTSDIAQKALAGSELWWLAATSLVLLLLTADGDSSIATVGGPRSVAAIKPDGTVGRRRLTLVLPGGVRPKNPNGRWQMVDLGGLWEARDTRIVVDTYGLFWRNAMAINSYAEFERWWLQGRNQIFIGPHTHAATRYFDGYVEWVTDSRPIGDSGAQLPKPDWDLSPDTPAVVPIDAKFGVTAIVQNGARRDAEPVEAARALLQARFDLKLGFWDLVNNHTLRSTLLKVTPAAAPPSTTAPMTAGALRRHQERQETRSDEAKRYDEYREALVGVMASLNAPGWASWLPGPVGDVGSPFRRTYPIAFSPDCDEVHARIRHPALRPGMPILWLELAIVPGSWGRGEVELIVPAPLTVFSSDLCWPFMMENFPLLEQIAHPHSMKLSATHGHQRAVSYQLAEFAPFPAEPSIDDWEERLEDIVRRAPAWTDLLAPLAEKLRRYITVNPRLGRALDD